MIGPYPGATVVLDILTDLRGWYAREAAASAVDFHRDWSGWEPDTAREWLAKAADRKRDAAADVGTAVHEWVAARACGAYTPPAAEIAGHGRQFDQFLADFNPTFLEVERAVFGDGYAGTFDFIADFPGHGRLLVDIKTGKSVHPEAVALQLAAYRHAYWMPPANVVDMTPDHFYTWTPPGPSSGAGAYADVVPGVDGCAVLHLRPRSHRLIPVTAGPDQHRTFQYCIQLWHHLRDAAALAGDPLTPTEEADRG